MLVKGETQMKCPRCKGKTEYFKEVFNDGKRRREILVECDMCHGSGEVELTNEEWLRQCTTEQLAWFIADACYELQDAIWSNCEDTSCDYRQTDKDYWLEWLKQPHTTE